MNIVPINSSPDIQSLLSSEGLPYEDLSTNSHIQLFGYQQDHEVAAMIGVEFYGDVGLVRSLVVKKAFRDNAYGKGLLQFIESFSSSHGLDHLYLLTTTTSAYFAKHGYKKLDRANVPAAIANTSQFSSLCPSSATLMFKQLREHF